MAPEFSNRPYLLTIASSSGLDDALKELAVESAMDIAAVSTIAEAKRLLIRNLPKFILCSIEVSGDEQAGVSFCKQLQDHPQLGAVPVILFSSRASQEILHGAAVSGARGFIRIPVDVTMLRQHLSGLLGVPSAVTVESKSAPTPARGGSVAGGVRVPQSSPPLVKQEISTPVSAPPQPKVLAQLAGDEELQKKLDIAHGLIEKVLVNLRSSQLLQVVDLEDVPKVVAEITRSVCGSHADVAKVKKNK